MQTGRCLLFVSKEAVNEWLSGQLRTGSRAKRFNQSGFLFSTLVQKSAPMRPFFRSCPLRVKGVRMKYLLERGNDDDRSLVYATLALSSPPPLPRPTSTFVVAVAAVCKPFSKK